MSENVYNFRIFIGNNFTGTGSVKELSKRDVFLKSPIDIYFGSGKPSVFFSWGKAPTHLTDNNPYEVFFS